MSSDYNWGDRNNSQLRDVTFFIPLDMQQLFSSKSVASLIFEAFVPNKTLKVM